MGFTKTIVLVDNFKRPVEFRDAYVKVAGVDADKAGMKARVIFFDRQGGEMLQESGYIMPLDLSDGSPNFIAQAYAHLKTLPEFAGATDC